MKVQKSFDQSSKIGILYVVGTPIGNLQDFSPRAREILANVDLIAAEDTRHTKKLLSAFQFSTPLTSYHEHNEQSKGKFLIQQLLEGKSVALVSDAGMPGISDPGEVVIREAVQEGITVVPIPGPSAALTALVASGLVPQPFLFLGFFPREKKDRRKELKKWATMPVTLICYEAPHRLVDLLSDAMDAFGDRQVAIARELTKKHEEWLRGSLSECLSYIKENGVRGEYVCIFEGTDPSEWNQESPAWWSGLEVMEHVEHYLRQGMSTKDAILQTSKDRGVGKREIYNLYHT
ncbi:16S rRNA (cytidine(1402)-2'-O)-methyltransferase [Thermoactinomyces sp. DSM 45892]|uniref:16S rRNA (cytidine(1402)-2'-O)-methyltransferase n=1 Tax=Thermoactinomyces sp. DSM 45892 TaxID=1882753 RepID=UPI000895FC1B|nr:16S rRNA (cytidine(1402)-2'-O)-methyltransferase [Thermoactinomyces sp. DSM 45892]SDY95672.1 16S rRNA (cytidine1402-2'-O)-methyltransferase [Thermoactinomyces sp. DSM 45892]